MTDARPQLIVRPAFQQDLELIQLIYAHHVITGAGTFEVEPPSLAEMTARWSAIVQRGWPFVVACPSVDPSRVLGYAYAQQYRDRAAYEGSYEVSVYVAPTSLRRGVGGALLRYLLIALQQERARTALAFIGDSANAASIALHAKFGFKHVGTLKDVGLKFGKLLDVVIMQRGIPPPRA